MTLQYQHTTQPDPDGLGPAARTLRDTEHDPSDWLQDPAVSANEGRLYEDDSTMPRDPRVMEPRVLRVALLISAATLAIILGALYTVFG
jgi:hypothetical protein